MEKDQNINSESQNDKPEEISAENQGNETNQNVLNDGAIKEVTPEEKILELEDKVARTFAEMENQRRRFEKEREDAFNYGGFTFAKETLSLIDNLERSKQILKSDETLKNSDALKKTFGEMKLLNKYKIDHRYVAFKKIKKFL